MSQKNYNTISGSLFIIVALVHLWRAVTGTPIMFGATSIPLWLSWVGFILLLVIGSYGIKHGRKG